MCRVTCPASGDQIALPRQAWPPGSMAPPRRPLLCFRGSQSLCCAGHHLSSCQGSCEAQPSLRVGLWEVCVQQCPQVRSDD